MERNDLISIGRLSKLTNVHVQSLRYYERLGILKPAYINPASRYRYYSFSQIRIVEAIQYCVELDIPLREFSSFLSDTGSQIDYAGLINYGNRVVGRKLEKLKKSARFFENMHKQLLHAKVCMEHDTYIDLLPSKTYLTTPFEGTQMEAEFHKTIMELLQITRENHFETDYEIGLLSQYDGPCESHYAYVRILNGDKSTLLHPMVLCVPAGNYLCQKKKESNIQIAPELYPEQFQQDYRKIVIETDLFTEQYEFCTPLYELRCLLPD